jgi:hypothetical protein
MKKEDFTNLHPPPPLTGENAQAIQAPANRPHPEGVHQVYNNNNTEPRPHVGQNVYEDPDMCCVDFVTEPNDRQSLHQRCMQVNDVIPIIPRLMQWSK